MPCGSPTAGPSNTAGPSGQYSAERGGAGALGNCRALHEALSVGGTVQAALVQRLQHLARSNAQPHALVLLEPVPSHAKEPAAFEGIQDMHGQHGIPTYMRK